MKFGIRFFGEFFAKSFRFFRRFFIGDAGIEKRLNAQLIYHLLEIERIVAVDEFGEEFFGFFAVSGILLIRIFFFFDFAGYDVGDELHFERLFFNASVARFVGDNFLNEFQNFSVDFVVALNIRKERLRFNFECEDLQIGLGAREHFVGERVDLIERIFFGSGEDLKFELIRFD